MLRRTIAILLAATASAAADAQDLHVSLRPAVAVTGSVTIGDVARLTGDQADRVSTLSISPDTQGQVSADEIVAALIDAGIGRHRLLLRGPDACEVRVSYATASEPVVADEWDTLASPRTVQETPTIKEIEDEIDVDTSRVARLVRPVARGVVIQPADVAFDTDTSSRGRFANADAVVGQRAARKLDVDDVVQPHDLVAPLLVKRGQRIKVALASGGVVINSIATSQDDGGFGQVIRCRVDATGESLRVVVTGAGVGRVTF